MKGSESPIILKRRKVQGGEAHHGGAWKVAMCGSCRDVARFAP